MISRALPVSILIAGALAVYVDSARVAWSYGIPDDQGRRCASKGDGTLDFQQGNARCSAIIQKGNRETVANRYAAHINRALLKNFSMSGGARQALPDIEAAIALNPNRPEAHAERGRMLSEIGELDGAIQSLSRALEIEPMDARILWDRGNAFRRMDRLDEALTDLKRAVALDPNGWYYYGSLGIVLERKGELEAARDALRIAAENYPKIPEFKIDLERVEAAIATKQGAVAPMNSGQSARINSGPHPSALRPFYPPEVYQARPADGSDDCMSGMKTENCFRQVYQRHAVVDPAQASRDAKMVIVISRDRQPRSAESIGIGVHPRFAKSAQVLACNNLELYDPAEARACIQGTPTWRGQLSTNRSGRLETHICSNGGYFALYSARQNPGQYAWGIVCGAMSIDAAKREAEQSCAAHAAAVGIPPNWQVGPNGHGCLLAISGFNDGIDYRHTLPRNNHQNFMCFGRERQRYSEFMSFQHTNVPNAVRVDASCTHPISPVSR